MYTSIWNAVRGHLSAERMRDDIGEFFEFSRWSSFDRINALAQRIAEKMREIGLEDVRLIEFPADGRTAYGGWVMPGAYDVQDARLTLLTENNNEEDNNKKDNNEEDSSDGTVLADYRVNPTSLMLYSMPTPPEGITAELVVADRLTEMTPARVGGRLVLTDGIGVEVSLVAMRAGALGVVSDCRNAHRVFKNGPQVDLTNEWHNYTIPPWNDAERPDKGFGFSISPQQGRRLREMLATGQRVRLHALVDSRHYEGILPVVSGRLPGTEPDEIVLTGHYDEYGADDNCSQVAVGLEVCRAIRAMLASGQLPPLQRGIRLLFPMEVRGFNALIQDEAETRHMRAGLNIDTVGTDQDRGTTTCTLTDNFFASPSYTEEFAAELLTRLAEENPLFRWRRTDADMIDNIFGEPLIGAPTPAIWHYSATHHLATDTPDRISGRMLVDMARVAATYAAFLANADLPEAIWLAELVADGAERRVQELTSQSLRGEKGNVAEAITRRRQVLSTFERYEQKLSSTESLVRPMSLLPSPEIVAGERPHLLSPSSLMPQDLLLTRIGKLRVQLRCACLNADLHIAERYHEFFGIDISEQPADLYIAERYHEFFLIDISKQSEEGSEEGSEEEVARVSRCVPLKTFRGFLAFEDLKGEQRQYVHETLGIAFGWGAPMWLQNALMLANGRRTAAEIAALLHLHTGTAPAVEKLERIFEFLAERGQVRLRPYLTQGEIETALREAGIGNGDIVLGHFALSRFGYIEGGAEALIDTLLSILGSEGTLMMPTFTYSWVGRLPYYPRTTPSRVGTVTDQFWRRSGVLRSAHPTHSFAATGPHAQALLAGHDYTRSPLSQDGPLGRLAELDGKILLFSPPNSNTSLHVGEYQAGLPLQSFLCPIVENGVHREVLVPDCPWHSRFAPAYAKLYAHNQVTDIPLGESTLHTMRCRDAISAQSEVMRTTPHLLLSKGCNCLFCQRLEEYCAERDAE